MSAGELRWEEPSRVMGSRGDLGEYGCAADALCDGRGQIVRCTPWRWTRRLDLGDGSVIYCKHRSRSPGDAEREWQTLRGLSDLGLTVPGRLLLARRGRDSVVGMFELKGRPMDAAIRDAFDAGATQLVRRYVLDYVVPSVQRLHRAGLVYRDLYWNHLFVERLDGDRGPGWIDVERVFAPRRRWRRWLVKDLAGLISSWPVVDRSIVEEALVAYGADAGTIRDAARKAARIERHVPKYG